MNDNKGRDIFYGVVAIATLIIAMIGATLAYFSITVSSNTGAVNARAATVSIDYEDGQQVVMQAEELIPSSFEIVKAAYSHAMSSITEDDSSPRCFDSTGDYEVCSVYRFTISSEGNPREMKAYLNTEENTFKSTTASGDLALGYALYNVTESKWHDKLNRNGSNGEYDLIPTYCDNADEDSEKHCYDIDETTGAKNYKQSLSIFGETATHEIETLSIGAPRTFDLVLFLLETNGDQNIDQNKYYSGTIKVSLADNENNSIITGQGNWTN